MDSQYVADVTIPDGTVLGLGAPFVKTWRVKNSGTCAWNAGFQLLFVSGEQMGGPASVSLPTVPAGGQTDISVSLTAPASYGTHKGTWRIRALDGTFFGTNLTVVIAIPAPVTETPLPTSTPLPTDAPTEEPTPEPTLFGITPILTIVVTLQPPPLILPQVEHALAQESLASGATGYATAACPAGSTAVSGGYAAHP